MTSIIRVAAAVNRVIPADSQGCLTELWRSVEEMEERVPDIILFPALSLSGVCCGSLFKSSSVLDDCRVALEQLCIMSAHLPSYLVAGLPMEDGGRGISAMAVIQGGAVQGLLQALEPPGELAAGLSEKLLPIGSVFRCGALGFSVLPCNINSLPRYMHLLDGTGCDLVLVPSAQPAVSGGFARGCTVAAGVSRDFGVAVAVANAGAGEVSSPHIYRGWCGVWECGRQLSLSRCDNAPAFAMCDVDADIIRGSKVIGGCAKPVFSASVAPKSGLLRRVEREPFTAALDECGMRELFDLQSRSLAARLANCGIEKAVLGVSGGLDSTLAIMVAAQAIALLGLPRDNLIGVTMPGFGTSERTYANAVGLIDALGARRREISIKDACQRHYEAIGLPSADRGAAYENAQARERTQILMDIGNMENALVVGTGDLSEAALGWCTFGGDHLAGYNVNACLTKGMVRGVCAALAAMPEQHPAVSAILADVLETPVSPELLPLDRSGEIAQRSEDILGPYELHDFFLYYLVKYNMRLSKIYHYACIAFSDSYRPDYIKDRLVFFARRFFASQFKRSCQTDSAAIAEPNLTSAGFAFPADISPSGLLAQLSQE